MPGGAEIKSGPATFCTYDDLCLHLCIPIPWESSSGVVCMSSALLRVAVREIREASHNGERKHVTQLNNRAGCELRESPKR